MEQEPTSRKPWSSSKRRMADVIRARALNVSTTEGDMIMSTYLAKGVGTLQLHANRMLHIVAFADTFTHQYTH